MDIRDNFLAQFIKGFLLPVKAAKLLYANDGLKRYAVLPFLVNVFVFFLVIFGVFYWAVPAIDFEQYSPLWAGSAGKFIFKAVKWIFSISIVLTFFYFGFTALGMIVASPFNDYLSEKVELSICGKSGAVDMPFKKWVKMTLFSLLESAKIALKQVVVMVAAIPLLLIPVVGFIPMFIASSYFSGLGFFDVALARHFLNSRHRKAGMKNIRWQIFGLGAAMELSLLIPLLGLFVFPLGAVAATILFCEIDWENRFESNGIAPPEDFVYPVKKN